MQTMTANLVQTPLWVPAFRRDSAIAKGPM